MVPGWQTGGRVFSGSPSRAILNRWVRRHRSASQIGFRLDADIVPRVWRCVDPYRCGIASVAFSVGMMVFSDLQECRGEQQRQDSNGTQKL